MVSNKRVEAEPEFSSTRHGYGCEFDSAFQMVDRLSNVQLCCQSTLRRHVCKDKVQGSRSYTDVRQGFAIVLGSGMSLPLLSTTSKGDIPPKRAIISNFLRGFS